MTAANLSALSGGVRAPCTAVNGSGSCGGDSGSCGGDSGSSGCGGGSKPRVNPLGECLGWRAAFCTALAPAEQRNSAPALLKLRGRERYERVRWSTPGPCWGETTVVAVARDFGLGVRDSGRDKRLITSPD